MIAAQNEAYGDDPPAASTIKKHREFINAGGISVLARDRHWRARCSRTVRAQMKVSTKKGMRELPVIEETGGFTGGLCLDGREIHFRSPMEALEAGIGMVHQELVRPPAALPENTTALPAMAVGGCPKPWRSGELWWPLSGAFGFLCDRC